MNYQFSIVTNEYQDTKDAGLLLKEKLSKLKVKENISEPDIVFVIGGDGTFLKAINKYNQKLDKLKFVTFKKGNISFYHNFLISEMDQVLQDLFTSENKISVNELDLLEVTSDNETFYAINEMRLVNFSQTLNCHVFINNELLEVFRGTGIIISTKTGSAGLMKTTGAAVILAKHKLMEYQELFPVNNNLYRTIRSPLILDQEQSVRLKVNYDMIKRENNSQLIVDTFVIHDKLSKEIKVKLSNLTLKVLSYQKNEDSLVKKLNKTFIEFKINNEKIKGDR